MTEYEWLTSNDPAEMLASPTLNDVVSPRKLRLFACAAFRASGGASWHADAIGALATAEQYADGGVSEDGFATARAHFDTRLVAEFLLRADAHDAARSLVLHLFPGPHADAKGDADSSEIAALLREVVGNPFRPTGLRWERACPVSCLYNDVLSLAGAAYDERQPNGTLDPFRLALVADALEEAGCPSEADAPCPVCSIYAAESCPRCEGILCGGACPICAGTGKFPPGYRPERDPASGRHEGGWTNCKECNGGSRFVRAGFVRAPHPILAHLRVPGRHVRGCWAIDLILGKR